MGSGGVRGAFVGGYGGVGGDMGVDEKRMKWKG